MLDTVKRFLNTVNREEINFHSILITRGGETLYEEYRAPFGPGDIHRMYSVTKSFVAAGIGALLDEGLIGLDDPIISFFPDKLPENVPEELKAQTVRNMLMMNTCVSCNWFYPGVVDRTKYYLAQKPNRPAGTLFDYDSTGSYVLGALIERLSGMKLLDYLKAKFLNKIGGFENACILETPDGTAWGDSALCCTPRALERFARFVMQEGMWEGEQLVSAAYMRDAVSCRTATDVTGKVGYNNYGYGYQIWRTQTGGFAFHGMGGQQMICEPEKRLIFVCTGDNQFNAEYGDKLYTAFFDAFVPDERDYPPAPALSVAHGAADSGFAEKISGKTFVCGENAMGLKRFRLCFTRNGGVFEYENAQGEKRLPFGMKENVFGSFPQRGYSNDRGNVHDESSPFMYRCAASAGWVEEQKLQLRVQIIDRYFGSLVVSFGFRDEYTCGIRMIKSAEDFLNEYNGWAGAYRERT